MKATDKAKLLTAIKLYLTEENPHDDNCFEIRIQLPNEEYVLIDLSGNLPLNIEYRSLKPNGFGYNPEKDPPITTYTQEETLQMLRDSKDYRNNNPDVIDEVVKLVESMQNLRW